MPFYTGRTADGSDMKESTGMYLHPNGREWSSVPYKIKKHHKHVYRQQIDDNQKIIVGQWICHCGLKHNPSIKI